MEELKIFECENFYSQDQKTPEYLAQEREKFFSRPKARILAFEGDQIIGRIMLHERTIKFRDKDIAMGGIGGVCTHRNKRNQGIATQMLERAMKILKEWDCDIAYLCAEIDKTGSLYGRVGFVPLNKPYTFYGRSGSLYEHKNGMIAPLNSREIFDDVLHTKEKLHLGKGNW